MIRIQLKDGKEMTLPEPKTILAIAEEISSRLVKEACAARWNGERVDLRKVIDQDGRLEILTFDDPDGQWAFRHTTSHILAQAIKRLYPNAQLAIGPAIEDGFYYDIDSEEPITEEQLPAIEEAMREIVKENLAIERFELSRAEAIQWAKDQKESYKVELIEDLPEGETISFYRQGDFVDLCAGPHLQSTGGVKAIKLTSVAGAYWRGSEKNKMLTRIYGTCFPKKSMLDEHLAMLEEAKRRDHRKLGKELKLFLFDEAGPGFPFFLPNGMVIKNNLLEWWRELHVANGYQEIATPMILNRQLWETSGHWFHYKDNMYTTQIDQQDYAIKPMNCPGGMIVYKSEPRSYRDLPIRLAELGHVHRHEQSGALLGLMRVRSFTQDDAHIYMRPDQITEEIKGVVRLIDTIYSQFNFSYEVFLSTRPEDFMGEISEWDQAEAGLKKALEELGTPYTLNEGDGAFYGPKIDFKIKDSIGRVWQCGTIQLDFQLPQRFEAEYIGQDGERHRPIMIHRAILGSIERFIGVLTEHCAGKFPVWLAPVQVKVLPISADHHFDYAKKVTDQLRALHIRAELDARNEKIGYKIRQAQLEKTPYMLIVGDQEEKDGTVSVRLRDCQKNETLSLEEFTQRILKQIQNREWIED